MTRRIRAFTLIELLVVIGVIAVLIALLIPSLSHAKQQAVAATCLSNLRQCGFATTMYTGDYNAACLPAFLVTTLDTEFGDTKQHLLWFNAIDPYLQSIDNTKRTGVAGSRAYTKYKQCPAIYSFLGGSVYYGSTTGGQNVTTEAMRSYKMNSLLRHNKGGVSSDGYWQAAVSSVRYPSNFVLFGDGIGMDTVGSSTPSATTAQTDNASFSMDTDGTDSSVTPPSLRHLGGACIAFVDGHAEREILPLVSKPLPLQNTPGSSIQRWHSEYSTPAGVDVSVGAAHTTAPPAGSVRNITNMPLDWSDFTNDLYR